MQGRHTFRHVIDRQNKLDKDLAFKFVKKHTELLYVSRHSISTEDFQVKQGNL